LTNDVNIQKDKIQLYQNQVFVTDNVEGIVPEFLTLLRGVIDSPDIPLNVSRSYLQADGAVKKISAYITRKVADKLSSLFKKDREGFEKKWNDIKLVIEYGMLSEEKFFEKSEKFALYPSVDDEFYTYEELYNKIKAKQTDKDDKLVILYTSDKQAQHSYIQNAKNKGYEVLLLDSPIVSHLIQKLESSKEKIQFSRVDSDHIDNLINKNENKVSKLDDDQKKQLEETVKSIISDDKFVIKLESMDSNENPFIITNPEFMRRMKEMQQSGGGGMFGAGNMPEMFNLVINTNSELISEIVNTKTKKKQERLINQSLDLAKLSHGLLKGEDLTNFIKRSFEIIK
jgi:molecular chaperone HtpG